MFNSILLALKRLDSEQGSSQDVTNFQVFLIPIPEILCTTLLARTVQNNIIRSRQMAILIHTKVV